MLAAPRVVRAQAREQVVVPEHVGLQWGAPVDDGAHCCYLQVKDLTSNLSDCLNVTSDLQRSESQHSSTARLRDKDLSVQNPTGGEKRKAKWSGSGRNMTKEQIISSHLGALRIS